MIKIGKFQQHDRFKDHLGANHQGISINSRFSYLVTQVLGFFNAKIQNCFCMLKETFLEAKEYLWSINKGDDQIKDLLDDHIHQSISKGWDVIIKLNKLAVIAIFFMVFSFCDDEAVRKRCFIISTIFYSSTLIMNFISKRHPRLKKVFFSFFLFSWGYACTTGNLKGERYSFYEMWVIYFCVVFLCNTFICLQWKYLAIPHLLNMIICMIKVYIKYDHSAGNSGENFKGVPTVFYITVLVSTLLVSIGPLLYSKIVKDILHLIKENKDLTETIQRILQTFPEGVIIQQFDKENKLLPKFVNNNTREHILNTDPTGSVIDLYDSTVRVQLLDRDSNSSKIPISKLLEQHCAKAEETKQLKASVNFMVALYERSLRINRFDSQENLEGDVKYYTIKTMKVRWNKNSESYMHIFIDSTHITKLEEERAKSACQKVMFASASHEFRTPLNAFENSLKLIKIRFDQIIEYVTPQLNEDTKIEVAENVEEIEKFIKMGTISSRLLMNLVEDILDLEKFDSGVFSNNISRFHLFEIIDDIKYMFETQCNERGLFFRIVLQNESLRKRSYVSDPGRIKQVLVNLLSNALKFTHFGGIEISIEQKNSLRETQLWFSVQDTGIGISKSETNIFQMFGINQKHKEEINQHGTGIGLHISK
ncbi:unnamed protein product [Moneuplotes crassus]|uniref:Histidine kinase domain-containing protein n=1 Tax=Euplotes crassus TaxID=5936 RepID=A0AAD1X2W8_EUPCR|nr:unnamed protein product [Moneuplotes crassus]